MFDSIHLPLSHTKKVFSNMKRVGKGFSNTVTPMFSTMMGVTHTHGEGLGSQPTYKTTPSSIKTYKSKKAKRVPSSLESTPPQPISPFVEHSLQENIQRETIGVSPNPKKVVDKEQDDHLVRAHTTVEVQSVPQDSMDINKTQSKATLGEQSPKGPGAKKPRGKVLLLLGRRHLLNLHVIHQGWVKHLKVMRIDIHTRN